MSQEEIDARDFVLVMIAGMLWVMVAIVYTNPAS